MWMWCDVYWSVLVQVYWWVCRKELWKSVNIWRYEVEINVWRAAVKLTYCVVNCSLSGCFAVRWTQNWRYQSAATSSTPSTPQCLRSSSSFDVNSDNPQCTHSSVLRRPRPQPCGNDWAVLLERHLITWQSPSAVMFMSVSPSTWTTSHELLRGSRPP